MATWDFTDHCISQSKSIFWLQYPSGPNPRIWAVGPTGIVVNDFIMMGPGGINPNGLVRRYQVTAITYWTAVAPTIFQADMVFTP